MRQAVIRPACLLGTLCIVLALAPAQADSTAIYWQTSGQCWQTGQLGSEHFTCENAATPGYLATHTVDDTVNNDANFALSASGHYCSYAGINSTFKPEEAFWNFETLTSPFSSYQEGDGHGDVCAAWAPAGESLEWGLRLQNKEPKCIDIEPAERCNIESYWSFGGQGLADRPWASYFGNPSLHVGGYTEPLVFGAKEGGGWGYLCPVLEEEKGNILELCAEQWRMAPHETEEWRNEHVVECRPPVAGFSHNVDKIALHSEQAREFWNIFHEPVEQLGEGYGGGSSQVMSGYELQAIVELDNKPYKHSTAAGARNTEPESGYGCGIEASTSPAQWALIGVSNGIEDWEAGTAQTKVFPTIVYTSFEPLPITISPEKATESAPQQETLTGTVNPYGFPTKYVLEYTSFEGRYGTAEIPVTGSGTNPVPITTTLTGLAPDMTYEYRITAFHYEEGSKTTTDTSYGPVGTFTTGAAQQCSGANITAHGSSLQKIAQQQVWTPAFHTSTDSLACNGSQGSGKEPSVSYNATGSGAGLRSWGAGYKTKEELSYGTTNAFVGTDEPPNEKQIGEIQGHEFDVTPETLETIPVAQESVAIIMHLPTGCTATSTPAEGRLVLNNASLEGIFAGTAKDWGELAGSTDGGDTITGTGCTTDPITPIVREDQSGTTHIFKRYLNLISPAPLIVEGGGSETWSEMSEGSQNVVWPKAADVSRPTAEGGSEEAAKVAATPGTIGYVNLAEARENTAFVPPSGGEGHPTFWAKIENGHKGVGSKEKLTYQDPSTNGEEAAKASANCGKTTYTNGEKPFPPGSVTGAWNAVTTSVELKEKTYPLCGLTYDLAFTNYWQVPSGTDAEATTVNNYLTFITAKAQGQTLLAGEDYTALPKNIITKAELGARASGGYHDLG